MAEKPESVRIHELEQLLISNTIQQDAVVQLLIEKGFFSKDEYASMVEKVLNEYQDK